WLDWSSGVLVTNTGHGPAEIKAAIIEAAEKGVLFSYTFPTLARSLVAEKLIQMTPPNLDKVYLLSTGAEAIEAAIKASRGWGQTIAQDKVGIISFSGAFHGRTMGAQMVGGQPALKRWMPSLDPDIHIAPFPNCYLCPLGRDGYDGCEAECFALIDKTLEEKGRTPAQIASVMIETYQGSYAMFAPDGYIRLLDEWCRRHNVLLIFDEVQAGFGRTGKLFSFEHYGVAPNLMTAGKSISGSLPVSAVLGEARVMDLFGPGEMTSTHSANAVCMAATLANLKMFDEQDLVGNARRVGDHFKKRLLELKDKYPRVVGHVEGRGLMYGLYVVSAQGTKEPDGRLAAEIHKRCIQKGLMLCSPLGHGQAMLKISPPLVISREAVDDGIAALDEAIAESA
ncbi:MAG: aminotransferase class III-fold pyridoxal phosphate-dependent enzyme, partial [Deltaproteobacteria bacterium]|nr:aminotransferase class III-fold pyridoxal phosphate-dependent enzyme [Deltaproteobacteria bacterium]